MTNTEHNYATSTLDSATEPMYTVDMSKANPTQLVARLSLSISAELLSTLRATAKRRSTTVPSLIRAACAARRCGAVGMPLLDRGERAAGDTGVRTMALVAITKAQLDYVRKSAAAYGVSVNAYVRAQLLSSDLATVPVETRPTVAKPATYTTDDVKRAVVVASVDAAGSKAEFARAAGISIGVLARILSGERSALYSGTVERLQKIGAL